jgi:hypothetical protein
MFNDDDEQLISAGTTKLHEALTLGRVTIERVCEELARDAETVRVREYWGDHNDEQRLVTRGIKLRIEARKRLLNSQTTHVQPQEQER